MIEEEPSSTTSAEAMKKYNPDDLKEDIANARERVSKRIRYYESIIEKILSKWYLNNMFSDWVKDLQTLR